MQVPDAAYGIFKNVRKAVMQVALNLTELEMKVEEATNNEPWGPHGTIMNGALRPCVPLSPLRPPPSPPDQPALAAFPRRYLRGRVRLGQIQGDHGRAGAAAAGQGRELAARVQVAAAAGLHAEERAAGAPPASQPCSAAGCLAPRLR